MKKILIHTTAIFLSLFAATVNAEINSTPDVEMIKKTITSFMQENHVPGVAVEIYFDGKPYAYQFGYANPEKKVPITQNTIFEVGSFTKLMTTLLLAQEVDYAKVKLTDSVRQYIKTLPEDFDDVTLQNLATHTGGIPLNPPATYSTPKDLSIYLPQLQLEFAPDDDWAYSNVGIGLLGIALSDATHKTLEQLYRTHILNPLHMQPLGFTVPKQLEKFYALGHDINGKMVPHSTSAMLPAAGSMKASASDMQLFLRAAIGLPGTSERISYPMKLTQSAFVKMPTQQQGLGWVIHLINDETMPELLHVEENMNVGPIEVTEIPQRPVYNGNMLIDKTGQTKGFRSYIAVIPNKKTGIVILTNKVVSNAAIVNTGRAILFNLNS